MCPIHSQDIIHRSIEHATIELTAEKVLTIMKTYPFKLRPVNDIFRGVACRIGKTDTNPRALAARMLGHDKPQAQPTLEEYRRFHGMLIGPRSAQRCISSISGHVLFMPCSYKRDRYTFPADKWSKWE
eukprot:scaffold294701_cov46-Prasinocladus_malaysianus.AAC.1